MNVKTTCAAIAAALLSACTAGGSGSGNGSAAATSSASAPSLTPIGKSAEAGGMSVTVIDVADRAQLGIPAAGLKAEPGETFVVVRYTLKNTGAKPLGFMVRPSLTLVDSKGGSLAPEDGLAAMASSGLQDMAGMTSDLNPGVTARIVAVWKVSNAAFDRATWRLVLPTDPQLAFALK